MILQNLPKKAVNWVNNTGKWQDTVKEDRIRDKFVHHTGPVHWVRVE